MKKFRLFLTAILLVTVFTNTCFSQPIRLFTGGDTKPGEKGINIFDLNREKGTFNLVSATDAGQNPTYFCISKKFGFIYAANEVMTFNGVKGGGVTTLSYNSTTGSTAKINELPVPSGEPCFISLSPREDFLLFASYGSSSAAVVKLDDKGIPLRVTDNLIFNPEEGNVSHPHMISFDPSGKLVYLTDLGLDRIVIYNLDSATGKLQQISNGIVKLAKGSGPRHFVFNADGTKMYVICELNSTVYVLNVNSNGELTPIQNLPALAKGFKGESFCADIHLGKNGNFLYGSNRGENTIVTFKVGSDGTLTTAGRTSCGGNWPRNFVIDPSGKYLLVGNQKSGNISVFSIDEKTGLPVQHGEGCKISSPACLKFLN